MANTYTLKAQSVAAAPRSKRRVGQASASVSSRSSSSADLSGYLTRAEFARYFELVNVGTETAPVTAIHALYDGLYSDGFVSALGVASAISEPAAGGLDLDRLEAFLTDNRYATRDWVINQGYITADDIPDIPDTSGLMSTADFNRWVNNYQPIDKQDLDGVLDSFRRTSDGRYVLKAGDTMTGTLTLPDLVANNSIRIGSATLTYDATTKAIHLSGAGFYSDSFISAHGAADGVSDPSSSGLNETELADYLRRYGYITSSALGTYATQAYVTSALAPYAKTVDVTAMLKDYAKLEELKKYVLKAGDTMTGTLTLPDLVANNSIRIGSATLTYDATTKAIHLSGAGLYSDSFISARGAASAISGEGVASINATLWGNRFTGTENLTGPISVGQESSSASAYVGVSRNSQTLQLLVGSTGARGLWDPNKSNWLIAMNAGNFIQFSAGDYASFEMSVRCSSYIQGTRFTSTVATGTAPLTISSSTLCTNLNADLLDGFHASAFAKLTDLDDYAKSSDLSGYVKSDNFYALTSLAVAIKYPNCVNDPSLRVSGNTLYLDYTNFGNTEKSVSVTLPVSSSSASSVAWSSITGKPSSFTPSSHTHSADDITTGTLAIARIPTGTKSTTVALGNHTHTGYALSNHTHSGYVAASGYERFSSLGSGNKSTALELNPTSSTHAIFFGINNAGTIRIGFGDWINGVSVMSIDKSGNVKIKGTLSQNQSSV